MSTASSAEALLPALSSTISLTLYDPGGKETTICSPT